MYRGFVSGGECNFSAPHSTVESLSGVQKCKNNGKIPEESNTISESFRKQTGEKCLSRILFLPSGTERLEEGVFQYKPSFHKGDCNEWFHFAPGVERKVLCHKR